MTLSAEQVEQARKLRVEKGEGQSEIALQVGCSTKTIQRLERNGWKAATGTTRHRVREPSVRDESREDRQWPNWTLEELEGMAGWAPIEAEENVAIVRMAISQKNVYIPWFYRRMVETASEYGENARINKLEYAGWFLAIAGLPVLAAWLDCEECNQLAQLIKEHRPWYETRGVSRRQRRASYSRKAGPLASSIKRRLLLFGTLENMDREHLSKQDVSLVLLISELSRRIPMFDKIPLLSPFRRMSLASILNLIFQAHRPTLFQDNS